MPSLIAVQHEDLDFDAPDVNDEFDVNIEVPELQQEMQQVISKQTSIKPFLFHFLKHVELDSSNIKGFPSYLL
jgi:hypothetical protein